MRTRRAIHCANLIATPGILKRGVVTTFAVEGIFSVIRQAKLDPWTQPVHVGANSELTLIGRKDPAKPEQNPACTDLVPTEELSYHGAYVKEDVTKDGIGAPLVAVRH